MRTRHPLLASALGLVLLSILVACSSQVSMGGNGAGDGGLGGSGSGTTSGLGASGGSMDLPQGGFSSVGGGGEGAGGAPIVGICGDGVVDPGEDCDDMNTTPGDGCSGCAFEPNGPAVDTCGGVEGGVGLALQVADGLVKIPDMGTQTTIGANDSGSGSCTTGASVDHIYKVIPQTTGSLTITLGNNPDGTPGCDGGMNAPTCYDRAIHVREGTCYDGEAEVGCQDSDGWWDVETLSIPVTAMIEYFVFVDGAAGFDNSGEYVLELQLN